MNNCSRPIFSFKKDISSPQSEKLQKRLQQPDENEEAEELQTGKRKGKCSSLRKARVEVFEIMQHILNSRKVICVDSDEERNQKSVTVDSEVPDNENRLLLCIAPERGAFKNAKTLKESIERSAARAKLQVMADLKAQALRNAFSDRSSFVLKVKAPLHLKQHEKQLLLWPKLHFKLTGEKLPCTLTPCVSTTPSMLFENPPTLATHLESHSTSDFLSSFHRESGFSCCFCYKWYANPQAFVYHLIHFHAVSLPRVSFPN